MALITAIFLFLVGTLGTVLSRLLTDEFKAWTPWVIQRVICRAIARLPQSQKERFDEEWHSHINEVPGDIGKLTVALGFLTAARKMTLVAKAGHKPKPLTVRSFLNRIGGGILLLVMAPLLLPISLVVLISTGDVFTATEEVADGRKFRRFQFPHSGRLGRFLFRTGLNHLPLLVNVLRGEMALSFALFSAGYLRALNSGDLHCKMQCKSPPLEEDSEP